MNNDVIAALIFAVPILGLVFYMIYKRDGLKDALVLTLAIIAVLAWLLTVLYFFLK